MTQSRQGEEPSARIAREGIVLPSDGGAPLLPAEQVMPADRPRPAAAWGTDSAAPEEPLTQQWHAQGPAQPGVPQAAPEWGHQGWDQALQQQGPGALPPEGAPARAVLLQKQPGVLFGLDAAREAFEQAGADHFDSVMVEGQWHQEVPATVARASGPARSLLAGERVALNLLGHLSGVATLTARFVRAVEGTGAAILDSGFLCHVGYVIDGKPYVTPTSYWREGDHVYWHGSSASRMLRTLQGSVECCLTVAHVDGLVLARSAFHHSINYRSVMLFGQAQKVEDPAAKLQVLENFVEYMYPGRWKDLRPVKEQELKATTVLHMPIEEGAAATRRQR